MTKAGKKLGRETFWRGFKVTTERCFLYEIDIQEDVPKPLRKPIATSCGKTTFSGPILGLARPAVIIRKLWRQEGPPESEDWTVEVVHKDRHIVPPQGVTIEHYEGDRLREIGIEESFDCVSTFETLFL